MKRVLALCAIVALVLAIPTIAKAQAKPDFSGKWVQDMEKSDPMGGPGGGGRGPAGPQRLTITQTATELIIARETPMGSMKTVYKLDGTENVNEMGRGSSKTKCHWEGNTLVTEGTQTMTTPNGEMTMQIKEVRSLDADGSMVVATTTKSERGERTRKLVFKKG
jgi:hypothetical protein